MEHRYHINLFWYEPDSGWVAAVPDLPGCSAHGDTPEEAVVEVETAIELWIETAQEEDIPIPEATYRPSAREESADKAAA